MRTTTRRGRGGEVSHPSLPMRHASPSPASARPLGMLVTQPKDDGDSLVFVWTDGSGTPIGGVHKRGLFCASSLRHSAITRTRTADSGGHDDVDGGCKSFYSYYFRPTLRPPSFRPRPQLLRNSFLSAVKREATQQQPLSSLRCCFPELPCLLLLLYLFFLTTLTDVGHEGFCTRF